MCIELFYWLSCTCFVQHSALFPQSYLHRHLLRASDSCKCVVFRLDDIQDWWLRDNGQIAPLEVFREKNASVTLGIIVEGFGEDLEFVNYTQIGFGEGLFEPAIHGWTHVSYSNLSLEEQTLSISNASSVLGMIYPTKPNVFIPPYNEFSNDTLRALSQLGITIFSSNVQKELDFNGGKSILIAKNGASHVSDVSEVGSNVISHLPETIGFKIHLGDGHPAKVEIEDIISDVNKDCIQIWIWSNYAAILLTSLTPLNQETWSKMK